MINIFLTGGTGFIGSHFINHANSDIFNIKALRRSEESDTRIELTRSVNWLTKEIRDVEVEDLEDIDILVHFAAHSANVPYDTLENCIVYNVLDSLQLFNRANLAGIKDYVVAGSCFEYGLSGERYEFIPVNAPLEPTQSYPVSKAMASLGFKEFARANNIRLSIHRIFQVFGEGEEPTRLWPSLKMAALNGDDFTMTKGEQIRDFINVKEVAERFVRECSTRAKEKYTDNFKIVNVGSGNPQSIKEFSEYWWKIWKAKGKLKIGDLPYRSGEVMRFVPEIGI